MPRLIRLAPLLLLIGTIPPPAAVAAPRSPVRPRAATLVRNRDRPQLSLSEIARDHWTLLAAPAGLFVLMTAATVTALALNRRLDRLRSNLERELAERKKAEEALRDSEAFYHSLVESLPQNILRKDREGRFTFGNQRFCATVGKPLRRIAGKTDFDLYPAELASKYRADDLLVMQTGEILQTVEEHVTPEGETLYVQVIKTPLFDASGKTVGVQGIFWDVSERMRAEQALAASEERFALAVRGSNDGIWDWNVATNDVYYSPRFKDLIGFEDHEFANVFASFESRLHPEDHDRTMGEIRAHLSLRVPYDVEYRLRDKSGEYRWFHARGQAVWDEAGRATRMAGSLTDVTDRKRDEAELQERNRMLAEAARSEREALEALKLAQSRMVQAEKLAGLGQMVAGVAHEINNPLSFVNNNVAVLQRDVGEMHDLLVLYKGADAVLAEAEPALFRRIVEARDRVDLDYTLANFQGLLARTREGLRRIQQIVKDLRIFARLDEGDRSEVDLNAGIVSTANIVIGHAKKKRVQLDLDLRPIPTVTCYPARINQVVMNLIVNAIDACAEGGKVTVRTIPADAEDVEIEVIDNGVGIDEAIRNRIFDPFFTTKPIGQGTGLGLSISYGIVQDHGGTIEVDSTRGRGTRVTVRLPVLCPQRREVLR